VEEKKFSFIDELAHYIFTDKYARHDWVKKRRETWLEAIDRVEGMHLKKYSYLSKEDLNKVKWAFDKVRNKYGIPSMRSVQFGGKAVEVNNERIFNCCVRHIDSLRSFSEVFHLLLSGCGVGAGLSDKFLGRLPNLISPTDKTGMVLNYAIADTIEGWSDSIEVLLSSYFCNTPYSGRKIVFDYSRIRKKGTPLKTSGGRAPSYTSLKRCHQKVKQLLDFIIEEKHQFRMKTINAYDILMHISNAVLSGGIRRSAMCIVFMPEDEDMINAKINFDVIKKGRFEHNEKTDKYEGYVVVNDSVYAGKTKIEVELSKFDYDQLKETSKISWIHIHPQRARSNNSILLLRNKVTLKELQSIIERTRLYGEPAFVFADDEDTLFNPCFEISFIPITAERVCGTQFCNLSSINGAKVRTLKDFLEAVEAVTIIGTLQAGYTHFDYLTPTAKQLTEEESLLGVSITGFFNNAEILLNKDNLAKGAKFAVKVNKEWAKKLGINPASRVTCVKPEGTGSLALGDGDDLPSAGAHGHHDRRFFRLVMANKSDPVYKHFKKHNSHACEESVWSDNKTDDVIYFPIEVKPEAKIKSDLTALSHLDIIKMIQENWVMNGISDTNKKNISHNVSCTVEVDKGEWDKVTKYLFDNRNYFSAVSLLAKSGDRDYEQAPFQRIDGEDREAKWKELVEKWVPVDYTSLVEEEDETALMAEASCAGANCEINI